MLPLEDNYTDIIGKAQRGLRINDAQLAARSGVPPADLDWIKEGQFEERFVRKVAPVLNLGADALVAIARNAWKPNLISRFEGLACYSTPFGEMHVNSYLVWDPATHQAAAFDTGTDCDEMLDCLHQRALTLKLILVTHAHGDHVYELARLREATGATAFACEHEPVPDAQIFTPGKTFMLGGLEIATRATTGHSRGGTTYIVTGLAHRLAIVGDAMFAGSVGGGLVSYEDALRTNREQILTLPDDTVICPGHGPLTTVGEEKLHNPFFPEFQQS